MKAPLSLTLALAMATTLASATEAGNNNHHREKRAIPAIPIIALAYKSGGGGGGSGANRLPAHLDPNIGNSAAEINSMATSASMSGPLAVLGGLNVLASVVMAMNYFQAVNARRRAGYAYGGPYIQKRSSLNFDPESIMSFINGGSEEVLGRRRAGPQ